MMHRYNTFFRATLGAAFAMALTFSTEASAQPPQQGAPGQPGPAVGGPGTFSTAQPDGDSGFLRPSSRATFIAFGLGPSFGLTGCSEAGCSDAGNFTQVKLAQEIGYHVSGNGEGFAIGGSLEEAFGDNLIRFQPGVKMWWDIQPSQSLGLYIAPTLKAGYALFHVDAGGFGDATDHAFNAQVGVAGRLALGDRGMVFFRPFTLDTFINEDGVLLTYDIMIGGAVTF